MNKDKNKLGKLIAITSSKGGVGKTTLTSIVSTSIFNKYTPKVAVVDIDPQQSIVSYRRIENQKIKDGNTALSKQVIENNDKYSSYFTSIYRIDIKDDFNNIFESLERLKKKFDYIFLDFPGSLVLHDNTLRLLKYLDWIFVPLYVDVNNFNSTMEFISALKDLKDKGKINGSFRVFFNRYSKVKNTSQFEEVSKYLDNKGITLMQSYVYDSVEVERFSTILAPRYSGGKKNIYNWIDELYNLIELNK